MSNSRVVLPEDVLLVIFNCVHLDCVHRSDPLSDIIAYPDLLSCSRVCRLWGDTVPHVLYRDICVRVNVVRFGPARRLAPSNWSEFSQLENTLSRFAKSPSQSRVFNVVESLQIDVDFRSSELEDVGPTMPSRYPPRNTIYVGDDLPQLKPFCNLDDLADILAFLPRLQALSLIARPLPTGHEQRMTPHLPSRLTDLLSSMTCLKNLRLECYKYLGYSAPSAWPDLITACATVTHLQVKCRTNVWDMWALGSLRSVCIPTLKVLSIGFRGIPAFMERLTPLCSHLRTLILQITSTARESIFDLRQISTLMRLFPRTLCTFGFLSESASLYLPVGQLATSLRLAMEAPTQLTTLVVRGEDWLAANIIQATPDSVRRLAIDLGGSEWKIQPIPMTVLSAIRSCSERLDVVHVYPPRSLSPEEHEIQLRKLKIQLERYLAPSFAGSSPTSIHLSTGRRGPG
ncbi:hypothetical protein BKA62DRAFT_707050 [Auriculariales sp. MPI-PUGE-AT-0066]|nr:hypothetical protein BKA62DRAFT_707050 [Auriculariales sp. MPI-PUGE-AT-0066]